MQAMNSTRSFMRSAHQRCSACVGASISPDATGETGQPGPDALGAGRRRGRLLGLRGRGAERQPGARGGGVDLWESGDPCHLLDCTFGSFRAWAGCQVFTGIAEAGTGRLDEG